MIDLHTHTNYSDGTDSVEQLLKNAQNKNLEMISITDHDTVGAYFEIEKNPELRKLYDGKIIVGIEMKTFYKKVPIEILGYGIDYKKIRIHQPDNEKIQKESLEKMKDVARSLGMKFDDANVYIDRNDVTRQWSSFAIANELLRYEENKEIMKKIGEFTPTSFYRVHQSNVDSPFYIDETMYSIDINETISRIHEAGGLAFLAHGYIYPFKNKDTVVDEILSTTEIDGMECIYTLFSDEEKKKAYELCKKYNKYMSGGSDYHAKNKPDIELGTGTNENIKIEMNLVKDWIDTVRFI
ncbi:MAG: PHP domain-containing protein [Clostridia bacterium]|nr:PHP domain-containing protein [Clostridia bacterium]